MRPSPAQYTEEKRGVLFGLILDHLGAQCGKTRAMKNVSTICRLSDARQQAMRGVCWKDEPGCPPLESLRLLDLGYWGFDGAPQRGELVVHERIAEEVVGIFEDLFAARFPLQSMRPIEEFGADDERSMAANNSSAFSFRLIAGTRLPSHHGLGMAIDLNPVQNPWVRGDVVHPDAGRAFLERSNVRPGMIVEGGVVFSAFRSRGWDWGGLWTAAPDYHHFSKLQRPRTTYPTGRRA